MAQYNALVKKALQSQTTLDDRSEHCSADFRKLASIGARVGQQIRIERSSSEYALYTVSEGRDESPDEIVRMAAVGRARIGGGDGFDAVVETQAIRSDISDEQAEQTSEFVERLDDDDASLKFIVMAPHGGSIEPHTAEQAERVHLQLKFQRVSSWRCKGFKQGGGAHERWHITSSDIDERSFPLLQRIVDRLFTHAVAFHGFDGAEILIGGAAPGELKQALKSAIDGAIAGSGISVRIAQPGDEFNGDDPRNIVNRLCPANGIQVEQSLRAREEFGQTIADAVASFYSRLL
jgi:phage replication-related protein YjqB (UPF0714/DUF867 family)